MDIAEQPSSNGRKNYDPSTRNKNLEILRKGGPQGGHTARNTTAGRSDTAHHAPRDKYAIF